MIKYRNGYKYQLAEQYQHWIDIKPAVAIMDDFISLDTDGRLLLHKGYATDGPSGPTIDTPNFIRAAFVHDALYQLIRNGHLGDEHREYADRLLHDLCIEDGMSGVRAYYVYKAVQAFGGIAAHEARPVLTAP